MAGPESGRETAPSSPDPRAVLRWLYLAMGTGVALFALVVFLSLEPGSAGLDPGVLRWTWLGLAVLAILVAGIVRGRLEPAEASPEKVRVTAVIVWALAEGQALFALIVYLLSGDRTTGILGLLVFAYLFLRHRPDTFDPSRSRRSR